MASCLRFGEVVSVGDADVYYANSNRQSTGVHAVLLLPDDSTQSLASCAAVVFAGADYKSLMDRVSAVENRPAGSSGAEGADMGVSADIFVGAALVLCVALGWIAGGQR